MTSLCDHEEYVRLHPNDKTAALALVDHRMELLDVSRLMALKVVAGIRRRAVASAELARATKLVSNGRSSGRRVLWIIREFTVAGNASSAAVIIKEGRTRPRFYPPGEGSEAHDYFGGVITVGARFVLRMWRGLRQIDHMPNRLRCRALLKLLRS